MNDNSVDTFMETTDIEGVMCHLHNAKQAYEELRRVHGVKQAENSKVVNDLYHVVEYVPMNGVGMVQTYKIFRAFLRERRQLKEELATLDSIYNRIVQPIDDFITKIEKLNTADVQHQADIRAQERSTRYAQESAESFQRILPLYQQKQTINEATNEPTV